MRQIYTRVLRESLRLFRIDVIIGDPDYLIPAESLLLFYAESQFINYLILSHIILNYSLRLSYAISQGS